MSCEKEDRAVITLQLGNYSNYVGAHFWNIQEAGFVYSTTGTKSLPDISNDVLFREGTSGIDKNDSQPTYTPRLVSVDLKGALGCLPLYGDLYNNDMTSIVRLNKSDTVPIWAGEVKIEKEQEKRKNEFLSHLDADEFKDESVRKKQKNDNNSILDDQDKDVCEYEEEKPALSAQNYEEYKKIYNLDDQVNTWSDYLSSRFHPQTNVVAEEYIHGDMRTRPFDIFGLGYNYDNLAEDVEDHIRFFAEEADYLKGFHMFVDANDSFGGVGCKIGELLADEYSTKGKIAFPCISYNTDSCKGSGNQQIHNLSQFLNTALTYKGLTGSCGLLTPLSLSKDTFPLKNNFRQMPHVNYQTNSHYHTSAILAAAVDTITLPWRSRRNRIDMTEILNKLNINGRKVAGAALSFPLPLRSNEYFVEFLENIEKAAAQNDVNLHKKMNLTSITPGCHDVTKNIQAETWCLRGINREMFKPKRDMRSNKAPIYTGRYAMTDSVTGALFSHFDKMRETRRDYIQMPQSITCIDNSLPTGCPFPHVFQRSKISKNGLLLNDTSNNTENGVAEAPVLASIQSSRAVGLSVKSLADRCGKVNLNKLHRFQDAGLENDELLETTEELINLCECYEENDDF